MKRTLNSTTIAAAALVFGMAATYGQNLMVAKVPFEFKTGSKTLPAGGYRVDEVRGASSAHLLRITNGKDGALLSPLFGALSSQAAAPRLVFACTADSCRLMQIWGAGGVGAQVSAPKRGRDERTAVVYLAPSAAAGE